MFRFLIACLLITCGLEAGVTLKDEKASNSKSILSISPEEHFNTAVSSFKEENWQEANRQFLAIIKDSPGTSWKHDSYFYSGVCFFQMGKIEDANESLSLYLSELESASHYEEAFAFKFAIADLYTGGLKKHLFNMKSLPKLSSGSETALEIYEEIIFSMPATNLAAKAYFSKASILQDSKEYVEAIDTYQQLITKFPTHKKSAEAFGKISQVYLSKLKKSSLDPDLLELARMNLRKAVSYFPRAPVIEKVQASVLQMEEVYALSLFETGRLYERKKEPKASVVYYYNVLQNFPNTEAAMESKNRLKDLTKYAEELGIKVDA